MAQYEILPERTRIWADARSSLHPIHVETAGLTGVLEADIVGGTVRLGLPTHIELEVERLQSHNSLIDMDLRRRLEARKYKHIKGDLKSAAPLGGLHLRLKGDLSIHGVVRSLAVDVRARVVGEDQVEVEGEKVIDMRDFGLTPPRFLGFRVEPTVKVRARLVAQRKSWKGEGKESSQVPEPAARGARQHSQPGG